jgi:transcriptional regulator with XRE-family HTH domain
MKQQYTPDMLAEFGRKLEQAMLKKDWSQSDLSAKVWGRTTDSRGYDVAKGRDRISAYIKGQSVPTPKNLKKIADALSMTPDELLPPASVAAEKAKPTFALSPIEGRSDFYKLHINMELTVQLVEMTEITEYLSGYR